MTTSVDYSRQSWPDENRQFMRGQKPRRAPRLTNNDALDRLSAELARSVAA